MNKIKEKNFFSDRIIYIFFHVEKNIFIIQDETKDILFVNQYKFEESLNECQFGLMSCSDCKIEIETFYKM